MTQLHSIITRLSKGPDPPRTTSLGKMIRVRGSTGGRTTRGYGIAFLATLLSLVGCVSTTGQTTSGPTTTLPAPATSGKGGTPTTAEFEAGDEVAAFLADIAAAEREPIDLVPTLADGAVTAEIGREGGSVTATGPDGTTYLLELPADALLFPTDITLTPLAEVTGFPFDAPPEHRLGVDLAPRGLELARQATLTITPAVSPEGMAVAALGYPGEGDDARAEFFNEEQGSILLTLEHFSGYVVVYPTELTHWRAFARAELEFEIEMLQSEIAAVIGWNRSAQLLGEASLDPVFIARHYLPDYRRVALIPSLNNAAFGCREGMEAVVAWFGYWRQAQELGVAGDADSPGDPEFYVEFGGKTLTSAFELPEQLMPTIVENCLQEDYEACVITGDLNILTQRIVAIERTMQLLGRDLEPAWVNLLIDYTKKCGQWRLTVYTEFEDTTQVSGAAAGFKAEGAVTRHIDLRWEPGPGVGIDRVIGAKIEGEADLELQRINYEWTGESCTVIDSPPAQATRARARIVKLEYEYFHSGILHMLDSPFRRRPVGLSLALQLGSMTSHHGLAESCNPLLRGFFSSFDDLQVNHVMFETGAAVPDPEASGPGVFGAMLIEGGWEFVDSPFRARFFKEGVSQTFLESLNQLGDAPSVDISSIVKSLVFTQLDILLTHTPQ